MASKKERVFWKVTSKFGDIPGSCFMTGAAHVVYSRHKFVRAPEWLAKKGYHLLCFRNPRAAMSFAGQGEKVWEVLGRGAKRSLPDSRYLYDLSQGVLGPLHGKGWWSKGTIMVEEVKLVSLLRIKD